jgi:hypothetical protein
MDRLTRVDAHLSEPSGSVVDTDYLELEQTQPIEQIAPMRGIGPADS